ncbi:MAG: PRC-barrel domain-containing protein, partial [Acidipropionibacterium jensenii]
MDIRSMDPQSVQELFDVPVVGPDGESVGTVEQIFADDVTGAPTFITVRNGDRECYIPVSGADLDAHTVTIPFSKDVVDA